ncbi:hypothetical protein DLAC_09265 [Tieghemostelium lacteum]|uniref:SNARE-complex protein Syntaxin-18 N-terminal domain-containing protein n=1 Tax=Tieghemostelium lacteum TaxID=361077 RepID=A0A151Z9N6_TIELA|nr:hypothetical protein DLAC_09265 [Tieghemostelium lacteum]|eukprot:KYQ90635.1 hypothetical protein DLAC_09265 [Tieghemostelium lacteum]
MIDRTNTFFESIRKKTTDKQYILQSKSKKKDKDRVKDVVLEISLSILQTINSLDTFLKSNKEDYINVVQHMSSKSSKMSDQERDEIDKLSIDQIDICNNSIKKLEEVINENYIKNSKESLEFYQNKKKGKSNQLLTTTAAHNCDLVRDDPNDLFSLPKETLENFTPRVIFYLNIVEELKFNLSEISNKFKKLRTFRLSLKIKENEKFSYIKDDYSENSKLPTSNYLSNQLNIEQANLVQDDIEFNEEERLIYEKQNEGLISELESVADQIQVINRQLEGISQMFDEITPHILSHKEMIENIYSTNVNSTNYIARGNNQIDIATKKTFDFRVMVLLFLIISSLVLLFLNWYQD